VAPKFCIQCGEWL